jgi:hypothetical protein
MSRVWLYDASGNPIVIRRPIGFARELVSEPFSEARETVTGVIVERNAREWWERIHESEPPIGKNS